MSGSALSTGECERLAHILDRLSSPYDGERAAAGLLATQFIRTRGLTWAEILNPALAVQLHQLPTGWREKVQSLLRFADLLNDWEIDSVTNLENFPRISERQAAKLETIVARVHKAARARAA